MEIPIAFPVGETTGYKNAEEYTLEQKQEALMCAEHELKNAIDAAEDFFDTKEDMDAMIHEILLHPEAVYKKPFMKKIASAALCVTACKQELEWASESVVDTSLTPAQVKAQVKQLLETQRVTWEQKMSAMEQQMNADRAEWMKQMHDLQEELKEEREHRKAFQAKVKDFSFDMYLIGARKNLGQDATILQEKILCHIDKKLGIDRAFHGPDAQYHQDHSLFVYKREKCELPSPHVRSWASISDYHTENRDILQKRAFIRENYKPTDFDEP